MISCFSGMNSFLLSIFLTRGWARGQRRFICLSQRFLCLNFSTFFGVFNLYFYRIFASILQYHYTKLTTSSFPCHGRIEIKLVSGYGFSVLLCLSFITVRLFPLLYLFSQLFPHGIPKTTIVFTPLYWLKKGQKKKKEGKWGRIPATHITC